MRLNIILLIFIVVFDIIINAKDIYNIGFIGNSTNTVATDLFDALNIIINDYNNEKFSLQTKFLNDTSQNLINEIKNGNFIAITGLVLEKHKKVFEEIKDIPVIIIGSEYLSFDGEKFIFRIAPSNIDLAKILCRIQISVLGKRKFAIIYTEGEDEYLKIAEDYKNTVLKNKAIVDYFRSVDKGRKDFEAILLRLRDLKVNIIFFAGDEEQAALLAKQASQLNVGAEFSSLPYICNKDFIKNAKDGSQGAQFTMAVPPSLYSFKKMRNFLEKYNETHKTMDAKLPYLFDGVDLLNSCLNEGKTNKSDIIECFKTKNFSGVTGNINFDDNGMRLFYQPYFYVIRGKEFLFRRLSLKEKDAYLKMN
jgi:hypothetical protein